MGQGNGLNLEAWGLNHKMYSLVFNMCNAQERLILLNKEYFMLLKSAYVERSYNKIKNMNIDLN